MLPVVYRNMFYTFLNGSASFAGYNTLRGTKLSYSNTDAVGSWSVASADFVVLRLIADFPNAKLQNVDFQIPS
jgi:hypothetical protein